MKEYGYTFETWAALSPQQRELIIAHATTSADIRTVVSHFHERENEARRATAAAQKRRR